MQKTVKNVSNGLQSSITEYLSGFQYRQASMGRRISPSVPVLMYFPTAEGYVNWLAGHPKYVYNYTDHLGNIRLSYTFDEQNNMLKIMEENHYYPFGLKHQNYNSEMLDYTLEDNEVALQTFANQIGDGKYNYKYNGKEFQEELGLNWSDYGARNYDAALGRWMNIDPLAETSRRYSPYTYALDNPVFFIDPDGMQAVKPPLKGTKAFNEFVKNIVNGNKGQVVNWCDSDGSWSYDSKNQMWVGIGVTKGNNISFEKSSSKKDDSGGFAFADGGNNQNPSELRSGGRDAQWVDFGGILGFIDLLLGREPGKVTNPKGSVDKGSNGGKPTQMDKINDGVDAVNNTASATNTVSNEIKESNIKETNPATTTTNASDMVRVKYDPETGNSTWIRRDVYEAQQKKQQ